MNDFDKILEQTEKAVRLEFSLLSSLEPEERKDVLCNRLHGTHIALITFNQVMNSGGDLDEAGRKIKELMDKLSDEILENFMEENYGVKA